MENPLRARMAERFAAAGISPVAVAISIGKGRDYIRDFLEGRKQSLNFNLVPLIAEQLGCDPRYLTGEIAEPTGPGSAPAGAGSVGTGRDLRITGIVESGVRRKPGSGLPESLVICPDNRYSVDTQKAYLVRGNTWRDWGIDDGSIVLTSTALPPRDGDLIIVEDTAETMIETTMGRLRGGRIAFPDGASSDFDDAQVHVVGVVVMEMKIFS